MSTQIECHKANARGSCCIVKMRHDIHDTRKGILNLKQALAHIDLRRFAPSVRAAHRVENYWYVHWNLGRAVFVNENIPFPSVNFTFEVDPQNPTLRESVITGVWTTNYRRRLTGEGFVAGVKFRPGAFYGLSDTPVSSLTDKVVAARDVFSAPVGFPDFFPDFSVTPEEFEREQLPTIDNWAASLNQTMAHEQRQIIRTVEAIEGGADYPKTSELASALEMTGRQLQRVFKKYVGVRPKWILSRARIRKAVHEMSKTGASEKDLASLAMKLGYYDQAHFNRDFKLMTGSPPLDYWKAQAPPGE